MKKYLVTLMVLAICFLFVSAWVFFSTMRSAENVMYARTSIEVTSGLLTVFNALSAVLIAKKLSGEDSSEK